MSGHNKWSQIKHQKGAKDKKRAALFTKILGAVSIAAKSDSNPDTNPRLRTLIEKAKDSNVPNEGITRALNRAKEQKDLKEFIFECVGPHNLNLIVEGVTDNSNRTLQQLRTLAQDLGCKAADPGSLLWAFELVNKTENDVGIRTYQAKFPQPAELYNQDTFEKIVSAFNEHEDAQRVVTNFQIATSN